MIARHLFQKSVQLILMASLVCSCGGGSDSLQSRFVELAPVQPTIHAQLAPNGTVLSCTAASDAILKITRTTGDVTTQVAGDCRSPIFLAGDLTLSNWSLIAVTRGKWTQTASTDTALPPPVVVKDGSDWIVLQTPPNLSVGTAPATLALIASDGHAIASFATPMPERLSKLEVAEDTTHATWQWRVSQGDKTFTSQGALDLQPTNVADYPIWGAMSIGDINEDGNPELLGTLSDGTVQTSTGYAATNGLDVLYLDRVFRDVRQVDLNGDGLEDIVSNVYGGGCTMIGMKRVTGGFNYQTPRRADGSCLDGNGETILVADFSGTGRIDIMLPTYQRVDYLRNEGKGVFTEVADSIGLSYPAYLPTFEGATAVDIDLNGTVDIVMGGEVVLNDGHGHFTREVLPLGANVVMQDEGLSVIDADNDGIFDIVKLHPTLGLRLFWGQADRKSFVDAGNWVTNAPLNLSYGLALGEFTGNALPDAIVSGGQTPGAAPQLCVQKVARQFTCLVNALPASKGTSADLQMLTDVNGDGQMELLSRDNVGMHMVSTSPRQRNIFRIDLRDAQGRRNMYGHAMRAICVLDQSLMQLKFVDGGNGYMSQSNYIVPFTSAWCPSAYIDVATMAGMKRFGPFSPGLTKILVDPNLTPSS